LKIDPLAAASLGLKLAAGVNFGNQLNAEKMVCKNSAIDLALA
jgi:hypothetical protein